MALFASETPELSDRFSTPIEFTVGDQSTAFSQEIMRLSQQPPALEQNTLPASSTDLMPASNAAVEALPTVSVDQQPEQGAAGLDAVTNTVIDLGFGTAAIVAAELATGLLTKNPKFAAMALETLQTGGKVAMMTSPKLLAPFVLPSVAAFGAATAGRHFTVEALTGKSESWLDSSNHVGLGAGAFMLTRYLGNKFTPVVPPT